MWANDIVKYTPEKGNWIKIELTGKRFYFFQYEKRSHLENGDGPDEKSRADRRKTNADERKIGVQNLDSYFFTRDENMHVDG